MQLLVGGGRSPQSGEAQRDDRPTYAGPLGHRNLAVVGDDAQSIYSFRGADVRNILDFQDDFPDARVVKLEQNYRSTETILAAANAVIANNRGGIAKRLWSELGQGDQIQLRALEDEHAEARFVVGEIERLVDEGASRAEIAVLYRTNAMSRVIEDTLVRREIAYQVIGGTKFYERAEIKDAIAYLSLLANPFDVVSFTRVANSPRRGIGADLARAGRRVTRARSTPRFGTPRREPDAVPGLGTAAVKALGRFMDTMGELRELAGLPGGQATDSAAESTARRAAPIAELLEALLAQSGYVEALEAERTIEAQGRIENLEQLVEVGREFDAAAQRGRRHARRVPAADRARRRRRLTQRRGGARDADDVAQREGPRVPDRVHHGLRGRRLSALARDRRGRPGGGAAPVLRRRHARDAHSST